MKAQKHVFSLFSAHLYPHYIITDRSLLHRGHNNIVEKITQVNRMNFILECKVIQCHGFQKGLTLFDWTARHHLENKGQS